MIDFLYRNSSRLNHNVWSYKIFLQRSLCWSTTGSGSYWTTEPVVVICKPPPACSRAASSTAAILSPTTSARSIRFRTKFLHNLSKYAAVFLVKMMPNHPRVSIYLQCFCFWSYNVWIDVQLFAYRIIHEYLITNTLSLYIVLSSLAMFF
jgi:hypothetical protein